VRGFAGISIHGLEADNLMGKCPVGHPLPLLRAVIATQVLSEKSSHTFFILYKNIFITNSFN
jgi:hypothetical protein